MVFRVVERVPCHDPGGCRQPLLAHPAAIILVVVDATLLTKLIVFHEGHFTGMAGRSDCPLQLVLWFGYG